MYFLEQLQNQFLNTITLYQQGPEAQGPVEEVETQGPDPE